MTTTTQRARAEDGFTLLEVLTVTVLAGILFTLGAFAFRHYWFVQSLHGSQGEIVTQLRQLHERTVSETHPLVFGARFRPGSPQWGIVKYDPTAASSPCTEIATRRLDSDVEISAASFATASGVGDACSSLGRPGDAFVFFFARGNATEGSLVVRQKQLDRTLGVSVAAVTGRVEGTK